MKYSKYAFTLVELVVGITISMVLMVSLWVFITSGMKNITLQQTFLQTTNSSLEYQKTVEEIFSREWLKAQILTSQSGVLLQSDFTSWKWNFVVLWTHTQTWHCLSDPDLETTHIKTTQFVWYEWKEWDFFAGRVSNDINVFSQTINTVAQFDKVQWIPQDTINQTEGTFITDSKNHSVWKVPWWDIREVAGNEVFWSQSGYLHTPTGITSFSWKIFVSDTGNNRIVSFDIAWENFEEFLNYQDGIVAPMWLFATGNTLFISDAGNQRILKYSQIWNISNPSLEVEFIPEQNQTLTEISFEFFHNSWSPVTLSNTGNFSWWGTGTIVWNILNYEFDERGFDIWNSETFELSWVNWYFSQSWSYVVKISLWTEEFYRSYFTSWIDSLEVFATGFTFPTWVYGSGADIVVNDFLQREWKKFGIHGNFLWSGSLSPINFSWLPEHPSFTTISDFVIEKESFQYKRENNMLHISFEYYPYYDCIDPTKHIKSTIIFKKSLTN